MVTDRDDNMLEFDPKPLALMLCKKEISAFPDRIKIWSIACNEARHVRSARVCVSHALSCSSLKLEKA